MTEVLRVLLRAALFYFIYLHHYSQILQFNRKSGHLSLTVLEERHTTGNSTYSEFVETKSSSDNEESCGSNSTCGGGSKIEETRYILYEVNPGEGFNLRRDIYIRIAPLIKSLNRDDPLNRTWVLVLPPWGRLPHWRKTNYRDLFQWSKFFNFENIVKYIPVLELHQFYERYGQSNNIDVVYQLQHFPLDDPTEWKEKIVTPDECKEPLAYTYSDRYFRGYFWDTKLTAKSAQCMSLRGQASTLRNFLFNSSAKAIMFDRAEVILWDHYGGEDWWKARLSLRFSNHLYEVALEFLNQNNMEPSPYKTADTSSRKDVYIGVHLRRRDFLHGRGDRLPSIQSVASQLIDLSLKLHINNIFLATDSEPVELQLLTELLRVHTRLITINTSKFSRILTEGELAIIDQILCSFAAYFVGTEDSTFTFRIFEEREIIGFQPELTYNYLCNKTDEVKCKQPTKWRMPISLMK